MCLYIDLMKLNSYSSYDMPIFMLSSYELRRISSHFSSILFIVILYAVERLTFEEFFNHPFLCANQPDELSR